MATGEWDSGQQNLMNKKASASNALSHPSATTEKAAADNNTATLDVYPAKVGKDRECELTGPRR